MFKSNKFKLISLIVVLGALLSGSWIALQAAGGQGRSLKWQKMALL